MTYNAGAIIPALVFPAHAEVALVEWRTRDGGRTGLVLDVDVAVGLAANAQGVSGSAFATHLGLGWEWF